MQSKLIFLVFHFSKKKEQMKMSGQFDKTTCTIHPSSFCNWGNQGCKITQAWLLSLTHVTLSTKP